MTAVKDKLITAEELKVAYDDLHVSPLIVSIPSGQWSGSGNDYYFTVSASNVTSNSILVPNYDKTSASYLNGPVWCVPASGSFTVHTTAIPSGTVNILIQFVGIMGEAEYQVLADVYSKSQTYSKSEAVAKADIVNNLTSTSTTAPLSANMGKTLNNKIINLVTKSTYVGTTDSDGDISILNIITGRVFVSAIPNRTYGDETYSSWFGVIVGHGVGRQVSVKCVNDNNQKLASQKVAIDIYFIEGQQLGSL